MLAQALFARPRHVTSLSGGRRRFTSAAESRRPTAAAESHSTCRGRLDTRTRESRGLRVESRVALNAHV